MEIANKEVVVQTEAERKGTPVVLRDQLLSPFPRITLSGILLFALITSIFLWAIQGTRPQPEQLVRGIPNIVNFVSRLFPVDFDWHAIAKLPVEIRLPFSIQARYTDTLDGDATLEEVAAQLQESVPLDELLESGQPMPEQPQVNVPVQTALLEPGEFRITNEPSTLNRVWVPGILPAVVETLQMALIGTALAVILAIPFALLAARNTSPHPVIYQATRLIMNANRAIPELIFALVFVAAIGLGPFTGVLALGIAAIGSMGRLYAEAIEQIDPQQVLAVRATGASRLPIFTHGVIPQVMPLMASYSLVLFEHNVRAATILGIVGAGGVGFALQKYMALFQFRELMGAVIVLIVAVTIIDRVSAHIRQRLI